MAKYVDRVITRLTAQQTVKLKQLADESGLSISEIIRRLIQDA